jgi:carbamoyltransferase
MDLALAIQMVTEEVMLKLAETAKALCQTDNLVMAGGVALNSVANGKLLKSDLFKNIWIQPAAGDAGGAVGAAYMSWFALTEKKYQRITGKDAMQAGLLGPAYHSVEIARMWQKYELNPQHFSDRQKLNKAVAKQLDEGKVVGWFQGRMEFGPRALGNRSILADARKADMQKHLNLKIKFREGFRPFAPVVLEEDMQEYFDIDQPSPYMLFVAPVNHKRRIETPDDQYQKALYDRLYFERSDIPAVTHIDYSARLQSVSKEDNPRFWELLSAFKELTHTSVLINTSFNVRGEPIVCTPEDAVKCFVKTEMDILVIENYLLKKEDMDAFQIPESWNKKYEAD